MIRAKTMGDNDLKEQFAQERERVIVALGEITDGGIIERLEHVGTTSVPDLLVQPCIDIALAVWPFPLDELVLHALASLGYELDPDFASVPEQRFQHASTTFRLFVVEAGSPLWMDSVLVREYLRHDQTARQALSGRKQQWNGNTESSGYRLAKRQWLDQLLGAAHRSWIERERFATLHLVAEELRDYPRSWYISGGWALDMFLVR